MAILIVASSQPRAGRSLIAAAIAYRAARVGRSVRLARLAGDDDAAIDAATFVALEGLNATTTPLDEPGVEGLGGDVVVEVPPGSTPALMTMADARVIVVASADSAEMNVATTAHAGTVFTNVRAADAASVRQRPGVLAVLVEDRVLAAPSIADIAAAINAEWLLRQGDPGSIERIMLGTVASDAASPYFGNRERKCVVTRFDKTDIQLAALNTDLQCLVITGGGEPSPYLLDRVRSTREDIAVLRAPGGTVETFHAMESAFGRSRFDGVGKMLRAVELLDAVGLPDDLFA